MRRKRVAVLNISGDTGPPWLRCSFGGGWVADFRLAVQDGRVVVAEVRVHSGKTAIPHGGLTRRLLRRVPFGVHVDYFAKVAEIAGHWRLPGGRPVLEGVWATLAAAAQHARPAPRPPGGPRPGRQPLPDTALLEAAATYHYCVTKFSSGR